MARVTTLTRKGQVTIPKEIRDEARLKKHDRIAFDLKNGSASLRRARFSLAEITGMLSPIGIPVEDMPALAWDEWVERYLEEND